ncbi:MAG: hypothetical protein JST68_00745 [Bacteroidetes bacterium]|nr:hypothetical protein [Bacteroidota bacterium]
MENEDQNRRRQEYSLRRAIMDYGIGVIIMGIGVFLLLAPKLRVAVNVDDLNRYMLSGLFLLYGAFRIYRGRRKDYYK